jgi:hypothetical protein
MSMVDSNTNSYGQLNPGDNVNQLNSTNFQIQRILARTRTMIPVQIMSVGASGGAAGPYAGASGTAGSGVVSVQPLVSMLDGNNQSVNHGTIYNIPYTRIYGGTNAVIIDPAVGDVGLMVVADRDISSVKQNRGISNPASGRKSDLSDGIYIGGIFNQTPQQFVQFTSTGITISDMNGNVITMGSNGITITTTNLFVSGEITAGHGTGDSVTLQNHLHTGVTVGGGNTQKPTAGT